MVVGGKMLSHSQRQGRATHASSILAKRVSYLIPKEQSNEEILLYTHKSNLTRDFYCSCIFSAHCFLHGHNGGESGEGVTPAIMTRLLMELLSHMLFNNVMAVLLSDSFNLHAG